ncbi:28406_t:CDS:2 [Dentiscutata erythropus]|uniref:28406_t:CDS:1 n=1 Tax=Dentiscutata erythropus TaxID=1348616 RepID=A0A9N9D8S6_9GLOM|nr:28406_t:CDS:2 [Dentiscutata erythropus]
MTSMYCINNTKSRAKELGIILVDPYKFRTKLNIFTKIREGPL